jgi:hypothetical protein
MFTLVQTPAAYNLPTAQPSCLESHLYLSYVKNNHNAIQLNKNVNLIPQTPNFDQTPEIFTVPIRFADNKYWINGMDVQYNEDSTMLPVLHHGHNIVPRTNIIPYLKANLYDVDAYMNPSDQATTIALREMVFTKLHNAIQYVLLSISNYPIAKDTFFGVRWFIRAQYEDIVNKNANFLGFNSIDEATMHISYIFATLTARLNDATYFGPNNKPSSLDFAVAAAVAFCLDADPNFEKNQKSHDKNEQNYDQNDDDTQSEPQNKEFLSLLLYTHYPTLVSHCHRIMTDSLGENDKLKTQIELHTRPICQTALENLLGSDANRTDASTASSSSGNNNTPRKGKAALRRRSNRNVNKDDGGNDGDGDVDGGNDGDGDVDGGNDENTITNLNLETQSNSNPHKVDYNDSNILHPDDELIFISRHTIGAQNDLFSEKTQNWAKNSTNVHQRLQSYAMQAWLSVTNVINTRQEGNQSTWAQQFLLFGVVAMATYFLIVKAKDEQADKFGLFFDDKNVQSVQNDQNDQNDEKSGKKSEQKVFQDFHRIDTPMVSKYQE